MRKQVHLPRSRRTPFVPLAAPLGILFDCIAEEEESETLDKEQFIELLSRAADGDPNIEIGASPEIAKQINEYAGYELARVIE